MYFIVALGHIGAGESNVFHSLKSFTDYNISIVILYSSSYGANAPAAVNGNVIVDD